MKRHLEITVIAGVLMLSGCATKKYVAEQVDPANTKISEVDKNRKIPSGNWKATSQKSAPQMKRQPPPTIALRTLWAGPTPLRRSRIRCARTWSDFFEAASARPKASVARLSAEVAFSSAALIFGSSPSSCRCVFF